MIDPETLDSLLKRIDRLAESVERTFNPQGIFSSPVDLPEGSALVWQAPLCLRSISRPARVDPGLLVGVERQQRLFYENVDRFVRGDPALDVLLWGERGTGKSSLVRSLLVRYADSALALLSVAEPCLPLLPQLLDLLAHDPRRWILFFDDLSFSQPGADYKEFKILLEGGLEERPENTLAVATSNRRHLVPESFAEENDLHPEESVAEEISLADRFGLSLGFYSFNEESYLEAVNRHLQALGTTSSPSDWQVQAKQWAMARGIRSGRSAWQAARLIAGAASAADTKGKTDRI